MTRFCFLFLMCCMHESISRDAQHRFYSSYYLTPEGIFSNGFQPIEKHHLKREAILDKDSPLHPNPMISQNFDQSDMKRPVRFIDSKSINQEVVKPTDTPMLLIDVPDFEPPNETTVNPPLTTVLATVQTKPTPTPVSTILISPMTKPKEIHHEIFITESSVYKRNEKEELEAYSIVMPQQKPNSFDKLLTPELQDQFGISRDFLISEGSRAFDPENYYESPYASRNYREYNSNPSQQTILTNDENKKELNSGYNKSVFPSSIESINEKQHLNPWELLSNQRKLSTDPNINGKGQMMKTFPLSLNSDRKLPPEILKKASVQIGKEIQNDFKKSSHNISIIEKEPTKQSNLQKSKPKKQQITTQNVKSMEPITEAIPPFTPPKFYTIPYESSEESDEETPIISPLKIQYPQLDITTIKPSTQLTSRNIPETKTQKEFFQHQAFQSNTKTVDKGNPRIEFDKSTNVMNQKSPEGNLREYRNNSKYEFTFPRSQYQQEVSKIESRLKKSEESDSDSEESDEHQPIYKMNPILPINPRVQFPEYSKVPMYQRATKNFETPNSSNSKFHDGVERGAVFKTVNSNNNRQFNSRRINTQAYPGYKGASAYSGDSTVGQVYKRTQAAPPNSRFVGIQEPIRYGKKPQAEYEYGVKPKNPEMDSRYQNPRYDYNYSPSKPKESPLQYSRAQDMSKGPDKFKWNPVYGRYSTPTPKSILNTQYGNFQNPLSNSNYYRRTGATPETSQQYTSRRSDPPTTAQTAKSQVNFHQNKNFQNRFGEIAHQNPQSAKKSDESDSKSDESDSSSSEETPQFPPQYKKTLPRNSFEEQARKMKQAKEYLNSFQGSDISDESISNQRVLTTVSPRMQFSYQEYAGENNRYYNGRPQQQTRRSYGGLKY